MSILIKGMKMPKGCHECPLLYVTHICDGTKSCPLVEVPAPHGKLVDADELDHFMYHHAFELDSADQRWDSGCWIRYRLFENAMKAMPTIIEAEEGSEE